MTRALLALGAPVKDKAGFVEDVLKLMPKLNKKDQPFKEIGGQPGWYAGASLRQDELGRVTALYYDNRADPTAFIGNDFGWRTKFASVGLETYIGDVG